MDWSALGDLGTAAFGIAVVGLPVQLALAGAVAMGRRVPVSAALFVPVAVLVLGLAGVIAHYDAIARSLVDPADPAWAPLYALYDRGAAAFPGKVAADWALVLLLPPALGAGIAGVRHETRGTVGPLLAMAGALLASVGLLGAGVMAGRLGAVMLGSLVVPAFGVCAAGALAAIRPRDLALAGIGGAVMVVGGAALFVGVAARGELVVADLMPDLNAPWDAPRQLAGAWLANRPVLVAHLALPWFAAACLLPGLGFLRTRRMAGYAALDIALTVAMVASVALAVGWAAMRQGTVGRLAGAHAAWVLSDAPPYDVPRIDVLPPRVLVLGERTRWVELREGGGVSRLETVGSLDEVGHALRRGDGLVLPPTMIAEDLYLLLVEAPAGAISLVGCEPVSVEHRQVISREALFAVGRCGSFPIKLRVSGPMPDPRELIVLKDRMVQDGLDVIGLDELRETAGRDVVLRLQVDATIADLVVALGAVRQATGVWLGWGVTLEGDDLAVGVEPGLRVVEKVPEAPAGEGAAAGNGPAADEKQALPPP
jgi:hypothetical protein